MAPSTSTPASGARPRPRPRRSPADHYVAVPSLADLARWVATGKVPPKSARMTAEPGAKAGDPAKLVLDANGETKGGIRTPWVDARTAKLSGAGNTGGPFGFLV